MSDQLYPCLWFDGNAKEAATFYCSIFNDGRITADTPMVVNFEIMGRKFMGLNAGPMFKFNESISYVIECDTQQEIDYYWDQLTKDGSLEVECGWVKDKFGLSWQVVPKILGKLMNDPQKAPQVLAVIMKTKKFNIQELEDI